jgi:hypothetical protein
VLALLEVLEDVDRVDGMNLRRWIVVPNVESNHAGDASDGLARSKLDELLAVRPDPEPKVAGIEVVGVRDVELAVDRAPVDENTPP